MSDPAASDFVSISCATGNHDNATLIARTLVDEHLAACVQISAVESVYRWKGEVQNDPELLLTIKTTAAAAPLVERRIKDLHTYDLPEIMVTPIIGGSAEYLAWVEESVEG